MASPLLPPEITLSDGDVFTGTRADGSTFIFSPDGLSDELVNVTLAEAPLLPSDPTPIFVNTDISNGPAGLRAGQTLTLQSGGILSDNVSVVDATLNLQSGFTDFVEAAGSVVNLSNGGLVGTLEAHAGSEVNIDRAEVFDLLLAESGSEVNVNDGGLNAVGVSDGSILNLSGDTFTRLLVADPGSEVNVSGGLISRARFRSDSNLNLFGTDFFINDISLGDSLTLNEAFAFDVDDFLEPDDDPFSATPRILSATLADGSLLRLDFDDDFRNRIDADTNITLTLVPEPASAALIALGGIVLTSRRRRTA